VANFAVTPTLMTLLPASWVEPAGEHRWRLRCDGRRCTTDRIIRAATVLDRTRRKLAAGQVVEQRLSGRAKKYAEEAIAVGTISGWEEARRSPSRQLIVLELGEDL
jgi:hypothetical protein